MVRPTSRRKTISPEDKFFTIDGQRVKSIYCRKCQECKSPKKFLSATDTYLDQNGYMSICNDCIEDIYIKTFAVEQDMSKTILKMARMLNVAYLDSAVQATISHFAKTVERTG